MNKTILKMGSIFASLFVLTIALMAILTIFDVMELETVKQSALKIGSSLLVLLIASGLIAAIQSANKD